MTQTGMVVGTPQYLSPEQALGKSIDARADLYSVGCMLFELLTGRLPFDGDTAFSIAYKHVQEPPPAPSSINRAISPAVDALVARALRKDPAHRFPTAEAMREEVLRVASGQQGGVTPLVIGGGPSAAPGSGPGGPISSAVFPQVTGELRTPSPDQVMQPYQPQPRQPSPIGQPVPQQTPPPYRTPQSGFPPPVATPAPSPMTPPPMMRQGLPVQPMPGPSPTPPPMMRQGPPVQPRPGPAPTPAPGPGLYAPRPYPPRPVQSSGNGCSTALVVVVAVIGVLVLAGIIVAIISTASDKTPAPYSSAPKPVVLVVGEAGTGV
jgi:serine/threonine-protein kinase